MTRGIIPAGLLAGTLLALAPRAAVAGADPVLLEQDRRVQDSALLKKTAKEGSEERALKALRAMSRIQSQAYGPSLTTALSDGRPSVREEAAFGLGQLALAEPPEALREEWARALEPLLASPERGLRLAAAEALGKTGGKGVEELLVPLLKDKDPGLRGEAAIALFRLKFLKRIPDYSTDTVRALLEAAAGSDPETRWKFVYPFSRSVDPRAKQGLESLAGLDGPWTRLFARRGLAGPAQEPPGDPAGGSSPDWWVRAKAYGAMADKPELRKELLAAVLSDPAPVAAAAALEAAAKSTDSAVVELIGAVLKDPASALELRGTAAEAAVALKDRALLPAIQEALNNSPGREWREVRDTLRRAAQPLGLEVPAEPPVRQASPWLSALPSGPASVELETTKGTIVISLAVEEAPIHCAMFLERAAKGLYDGTLWHRVVRDFVIQGGDPRGSGWGDGGVVLRDEINRLRFERGTVGMPKGEKDTGGCQLFITHVPTPHLDGRYTVFGRVVQGLDVVDRIEVGDRILKARVRRG